MKSILGTKKITSSFLISALIMPQALFATNLSDMTCEYADKYNKCVSANESGGARSIEDFICIESKGGGEEMLLQIILDEKFTEIDEEAEQYLEKLEQAKEEYFGEEPKQTFLAALDDISANFAEYEAYWQAYNKIYAEEVLPDFLECTDSITNTAAKDFLPNKQMGIVSDYIQVKLSIYRQVAYDILKLNRLVVRQDDRKQYVIEEREKYGGVMQIMLNILGYMERIVNGWVTKTKNPYGS